MIEDVFSHAIPNPARGDLVTEITHAIWKWGKDFVKWLLINPHDLSVICF